jgi:hypothetical protein
LVIGHAGDNDSLPAFGWIKGFSRQGDNLYAEVAFTDAAKDLVKDGHYRKVSISFYSPESQINPHKGKWSARHLALLGASPPAVKGLEPFNFSEIEGVFDFAGMTLFPEDVFDEELGPTMIVEKSPLEMLQQKLSEVREEMYGAVQELQQASTQQSQQPAVEAANSAALEPETMKMANPETTDQYSENRYKMGREGTEIAQQTADLEDQFPEEDFMEKGKISRKHAPGAHGQVMQVVENVYDEAHKESTAERKEAADRGFEAKRQKKEGHKGEAHETKELMKVQDKKLSADHKELPPALKKRAEEVKEKGHFAEDHAELEYDEVSYKTNPAPGVVKFGKKKESDDDDDTGRMETARSADNGYVDRMKVGKAGASGDTGRMKTAKSGEQDTDRLHTAENGEQDADRMRTAKASPAEAEGESRWAGQADGYDQVTNNDQYDAGAGDYPEPNRPKTSKGSDPYGRDETATKIPTETEEMPDDEVFAVQTTNVMSDKNMRVLRQTSSQGRQAVKGEAIPSFAEQDEEELDAEHGEGAGKPAKNKQLTPGAMDTTDDPAEIVGPDGAYAESYKGEKKASGKQLTPGAQDSLTDPAEVVGPDGAYAERKASKSKQLTPGAQDSLTDPAEITKRSGGVYAEEHAEGKKDPYTKTGFGSTYDEGEVDDETEEDFNELSVDHCGMEYGMGSMSQARALGYPQQMYEELMNLKAKYAELERRHAEEKMHARREKLAGAIGHLYTEGRLTDGIMAEQDLISYVEGLEFGTLEFSEGETAATKLLTLLSKLPPMVTYGEIAGGTFQYTEEDLDPHAKALKMVEESEGSIDYVEALKKTMYS